MNFPQTFTHKYGPWAVVTGASSGIGAEFARQLAATGLSIVLVARRRDRLEQLSVSLREKYPTQTRVIPADLTQAAGLEAVITGTADLDIGLLVNNAGVEMIGSFFQTPLEKHAHLVALNVNAVVVLAHALGGRIAERKRGGIVFVSSVTANLLPYFASYSSSKAFVSGMSLLLREELRPKGVDVLCLEPGPVHSELSTRIEPLFRVAASNSSLLPTSQCVAEGLQSLWQGKARYTPGLRMRLSVMALSCLPRWIRFKILGVVVDRLLVPEIMDK